MTWGGRCGGERAAGAIILVTRWMPQTAMGVPEKRRVLYLPFSIFFALLALNAISGVWQRIEPLEADLPTAIVTLAELLGIPVKPAQRFVDVPEESSFLAGKQERLFTLHRIGALIGHVE